MRRNIFQKPDCVLYACCGSKCKKRGGKLLFRYFKSQVKAAHAKGKIQIIKTGCTDRCKMGPVVTAMPENKWYFEVTIEMANEIFERHLQAAE